ncbi:venom serine carboxypeptidase-like [Maniola jurtina]|uniref:venom serine carboxypeptidase-like n=1 Tax=Maniola jurtina TaxID=191418 RepID=UPI001E6895D4|nr:venom serine carboxypeptidase-like [Maniola jurtina]
MNVIIISRYGLVFDLLLIFNLINFCVSIFFPHVYPRVKLEAKPPGPAGEPLILTPYVETGDVQLARNISRVPLTDDIGVTSHAGFFTVDVKYNSNLYFWYFPAFSKNKAAPVILWLQGGPGASSLFGLFTENGPLNATKDEFALRKYHWALEHNLIFIDNSAGTGFSFTDDEKGYCTDEKCVADGLYNCLQQFFIMFPSLRNNEFYITGESYAGKYIPSIAMKIHQQNSLGELQINLKGLALGNAYCDPINQIDYASYLYQLGLIDFKQNKLFLRMQSAIVDEIQKENWDQANSHRALLFRSFRNSTGFENSYNFLDPTKPDMDSYVALLNDDRIRQSVHVGGLSYNSQDMIVYAYLKNDLLKSVASDISELLSHYRLLFYNGQLDIIVAYPLTESFLRNLEFSSATEYETAARHIWRVGDEIAGYMKQAGNLTEVLVRNAGHMVPHDQPKWALDMITRFIKNTL